jgi:hypothetical protein
MIKPPPDKDMQDFSQDNKDGATNKGILHKETPEYRNLQTCFHDDKFCLALGKLCNWELMNKTKCISNIKDIINLLKQEKETSNNSNLENIEKLNNQLEEINKSVYLENGIEYNEHTNKPLFALKKEFGVGGWDVIIQTDEQNTDSINCNQDCLAYNFCYVKTDKIAVDVKPSLGDDYFLIIRKMKSTKYHPEYQCLVYEKFTSTLVTLEEVKKVFALNGFKVFSLDEVEKAKQ